MTFQFNEGDQVRVTDKVTSSWADLIGAEDRVICVARMGNNEEQVTVEVSAHGKVLTRVFKTQSLENINTGLMMMKDTRLELSATTEYAAIVMLRALKQIRSDPNHHKLGTDSKEALLEALAAAE